MWISQRFPLITESIPWLNQSYVILKIAMHVQWTDWRVTIGIVGHVKICAPECMFDSILSLTSCVQKMCKTWVRRCDRNKSFSAFMLPKYRFKTELENCMFPSVRWWISDQHILRIKSLELALCFSLFLLTDQVEAILVINWNSSFHFHLWHVPTQTSVDAEQLNNITLISSIKPMCLFTA